MTNLFERAVHISDKSLLEEKFQNLKNVNILVTFNYNTENFHLGHWILLSKIKNMIDLGSKITFVMEDLLLQSENSDNFRGTFNEKVRKILETDNIDIVSCKDILKEKETKDLLTPAALTNVIDLLNIDFIKERSETSKDTIGLNEFLEQLILSMAVIEIAPDIIIAGENKKFYLDLSLNLAEVTGKSKPACVIFPLLTGKNGERKMSFKYDNFINIEESGVNLFNQIHQIPDSLVIEYFKLLTRRSDSEISEIERKMKSDSDKELVAVKDELAKNIIKELGKDIEAMKEFNLEESELKNGKIWIVRLLELTELVQSRGEGRRIINQGGIKIDDRKITNADEELKIENGAVLSKGKKVKIKINLRS